MSQPIYDLLYHAGIPGRGEFIRLMFEATSTPYNDIGNASPSGPNEVFQVAINQDPSDHPSFNPPVFAPPALRIRNATSDSYSPHFDLILHSTPNIMLYLGPRLGLLPKDEASQAWATQIALVALDLTNEVHDTHHPVRHMGYYEEQKDSALIKAKEVREHRLSKYFGYFTRVLKWNEGSGGKGVRFVGTELTIADLAVWQVLDGCFWAFPGEMELRKAEFGELLGTFYEGLKGEEWLGKYLSSERRLAYGNGIFRRYPELDRQ